MKLQVPILLALGSALSAQSFVYSPSDVYRLSEGAASATTFGSYAAGRYQFADDNHTGSAMAITEASLRYNQSNYTVLDGMGRAFANVTLHVAETDYATFGNNFANNAATTRVKVFDSAVSWPVQLGPTFRVPAEWSVSFPFSTSYAYTGNRALLTDYTFTGGTLSNKAPWSGATAVPYRFDSFGVGPTALGQMIRLGRINGGCVDGNSLTATGASVDLVNRSHGPNDPNPALRDNFYVEVNGRSFGPNQNVLVFLAFESEVAGLSWPGVPCNNMHLPLGGRAWFIHPRTTTAMGSIAPYNFNVPNGLAPYTPLWHGIPLMAQAVWPDSVTTGMKFSAGARNSFKALPVPNAGAVNMKTVFDADPQATTASQSADGDPVSIPIFRYKN